MYKDWYWLNSDSRLFLERGYLDKDEVAESRYEDIAKNAENLLGIKGFADKFLGYLAKGYYSLSTPVITNFGKSKALPVSCFNSHISDTMESILTKAAEVGIMSKGGGGTSAFFGDLRPRGAKISVGGESSGPTHFMEIFDSVAEVVSQSNVRRGSLAAYLPVEHPDIEEFLKIRSEGHAIQNMSIGVTITDKWMKDMLDGHKENRRIWGQIIKKRFETGYPYIQFTDTVNNNAPQVYKDRGLKIKSSNLCCIAGSERVVTDRGYLTAEQLYNDGGELTVFNGKDSVKASEMKLISESEDVFKITLSNGMCHTITGCHKVPVAGERCMKKGVVGIPYKNTMCRDLKIGDKILIQSSKGIFGKTNMPDEAFLLGMYQSDGTQNKETIHLCLWENDFDLIDEIESKFEKLYNKYNGDALIDLTRFKDHTYPMPKFRESNTSFSEVRKKSLTSPFLKRSLNFEKGVIPEWIWSGDELTQWEYIRGLFYADGTVNICKTAKGDPLYLSITSINKNFLEDLQKILHNLGIICSIGKLSDAGQKLLPDGKGGKKLYETKASWRLTCGSKNSAVEFEKNTGFLSRKCKVVDRYYRDNTKKHHKIVSIEKLDEKEPVYCVQVYDDKHLWTVNGVITHNSEIELLSDDKNSFVCVLSSLNLLHWDEIKDTDAIETLIYFLDSVNEEFVRKTENMKFMDTAHNFAKTQRALGMGALGWHSLLQSKMIPFESFEAKMLNNSIWKTIKEKSDKATKELAKLLGEPELLKGYGERNVCRLAVAPTTSSSFILGQVSPSIEPLESNYFVKKLAKGSFTYRNPYLKALLKSIGMNTHEVWESILVHGGSVQHLDFLDQSQKDTFKTFSEISQKEIVIQAAQRQKYIDQSQSLNILVPPSAKPKEVSDLLIFGWENGIKTFYYQRSANPAQLLARSILQCKSCEG